MSHTPAYYGRLVRPTPLQALRHLNALWRDIHATWREGPNYTLTSAGGIALGVISDCIEQAEYYDGIRRPFPPEVLREMDDSLYALCGGATIMVPPDTPDTIPDEWVVPKEKEEAENASNGNTNGGGIDPSGSVPPEPRIPAGAVGPMEATQPLPLPVGGRGPNLL